MPVKVVVDRSACVTCGFAATLCPDVFVLGDDNRKNRVVDSYSVELTDTVSVGVVPDELRKCVEEAAEYCPVDAIKTEEVTA